MGGFALVILLVLASATHVNGRRRLDCYTASMSVYPDYTGSQEITGEVMVAEEDGTLILKYDLSGLESSTSGGIHIHEGTTCSIADLVGGHYYGDYLDSDPWDTEWSSDSSGDGSGVLTIYTNTTLDDNYGHALVIHESNGDRAACGLIGSVEYVASLEDYPDYDENTVTGTVAVSETLDGEVLVNYDLEGLEVSTSGGIHIHSGTTCLVADWVSGHYYDSDSMDDPWTTEWTSDELGEAVDYFTVDSGYSIEDNYGHALVVHDSDGTRVACGLIGDLVEYLVSLGVYPGYTGSYDDIDGDVVVAEDISDSSSLTITYDLSGLEADESGGMHIHEGTTCEDADEVGGHYYDLASDPWNTTWGVSDDEGYSSGSFSIFTNISITGNYGHSFVVHLSNDTRAACGLVGTVEVSLALEYSAGGNSVSQTATNTIIVCVTLGVIISMVLFKLLWSRRNYKSL